jgi:D-amino peptidase
MTDMEGASGIHRGDKGFCQSGQPNYAIGQRLLTADVNAAVEGAIQGGATEVIVNAAHGTNDSILAEALHPAAKLETPASTRNDEYMPSLDGSFSGVFLVGAHAMAGTARAFLDHTQSSSAWYNYYLNKRKYGEIGQVAVIAGHYNVPLLLVSGDKAAILEAKRLIGSGLETAQVKEAFSRNTAVCIGLKTAHDKIRLAARRAAAKTGRVHALKLKRPIRIRLEWQRTEVADLFSCKGDIIRIDGRTIEKTVNSQLEILNF